MYVLFYTWTYKTYVLYMFMVSWKHTSSLICKVAGAYFFQEDHLNMIYNEP